MTEGCLKQTCKDGLWRPSLIPNTAISAKTAENGCTTTVMECEYDGHKESTIAIGGDNCLKLTEENHADGLEKKLDNIEEKINTIEEKADTAEIVDLLKQLLEQNSKKTGKFIFTISPRTSTFHQIPVSMLIMVRF